MTTKPKRSLGVAPVIVSSVMSTLKLHVEK